MKEFILINYNLKVDKIYKDIFFIKNQKVRIIKTKDTSLIDKLVIMTNEMYKNNIMVDTFILNINKEYYTKKNNEYIILLKINEFDDFIDLKEIIKYSNVKTLLDKYNMMNEYKDKIDDFEKNIIKYDKNIENIKKTANYYIGMAENALSLLNDYQEEINELGHNINIYKFNKEELNNPLNFIKINKFYNISNYLKYKFINNQFNYDELDIVLKSIRTESEEAIFFSYMIYPNYYFDIFEEEMNDKKIEKLIKKNKKYIEILMYIKENLKKCKKIQLFTWLN